MAQGLFSFDASDPGSYDQLEMRRRIALGMMSGGKKGHPKNVGEGLSAIGDALGDIGMMRALENAARIQQEREGGVVRNAPRGTYTPQREPAQAAPVQQTVKPYVPPAETPPATAPPVTPPAADPGTPMVGPDPSMDPMNPTPYTEQAPPLVSMSDGETQNIDPSAGSPAPFAGSIQPNVTPPPPAAAAPPVDARAARMSMVTPVSDRGGGNAQSWYDFARRPLEEGGLGLTHEQAAGKVANLQAESGRDIKPWGVTGDNGTAFGAAQWRGPRFEALQKFSAENGMDFRTTEAQQAFMRQEYMTTHRGAYDALKAAQTPAEAATAINRRYEISADRTGGRERNADRLAATLVPGQQQLDPRARAAQALMNQDQGPMPPDSRMVPTQTVNRPEPPPEAPVAAEGPGAPMAALPPIGTASDAPPQGVPVGPGTRDSIANTLMQQNGPVVPQGNPTMPGATPPMPGELTLTTSPSTSTGPAGGVPPEPAPVQVAQARPPGPPVTTDIPPAPPPGMPPSRLPIPAGVNAPVPDPGPEPVRPGMLPPSEAAQYWAGVAKDPRYSPALRAQAQQQYQIEESFRQQKQAVQDAEYTHQRGRWESKKDAYDTDVRTKPSQELSNVKTRVEIEKGQLESRIKEVEVELKRAELAGVPDAIEKRKGELKELHLKNDELQRQSDFNKQMGGLPTAVAQKVADEFISKKHPAVTALAASQPAIRNARIALQGAITGAGANQRVAWAQVLSALGMKSMGNDAADSQLFKAYIQPVVNAQRVAAAGNANISDRDMISAEQSAGKDLTLEPQALAKLLNHLEETTVENLKDYQARSQVLFGNSPQAQAAFGAPKFDTELQKLQPPADGRPVQVWTLKDASRYPPGTAIILPDGRHGTVPR